VSWQTYWELLAQEGDQGPTGPQGTQGDPGATGAQGDTGAQGPQGIQGDQGIQGIQGVQGDPGNDGATGPAGPTGPAGVDWDNSGWVTSTLYAVNAGLLHNGTSYRCILQHTSGGTSEPGVGGSWATYWEVIAQKGDTGATGPQGDTGAQGDTGDTGAQGIQGDPGINWDNGLWSISGSYALDDGLFHEGSSYRCILAHSSSSLTEPGTGASWETYWEYIAKQGTKGDTGATGATGGVPDGGTTDQVLTKDSATDQDVSWQDPSASVVLDYEFNWAISTAYIVGDIVINDDEQYFICVQDHTSTGSGSTGQPEIDTFSYLYWAPTGARVKFRQDWTLSVTYNYGDYVRNSNGGLYRAIVGGVATSGTEPGIGGSWTARWELFASEDQDLSSYVVDTDIYGDNELWIPAAHFIGDGTVSSVDAATGLELYRPFTTSINRAAFPVFGFPDPNVGNPSAISGAIALPARWDKGSVYFQIYYATAGTGTGDVHWAVWYQEMDEFEPGESFNTSRTVKDMIDTVTTGQDNELIVTDWSTFASWTTVSTDDNFVNLTVARWATSDTFAAEVKFIGMKVRWTSNALNDD
jgi:hypothetical protein